jgi:hypothetical protein
VQMMVDSRSLGGMVVWVPDILQEDGALFLGAELQCLRNRIYNAKAEPGIRRSDPAMHISWPTKDILPSTTHRAACSYAQWPASRVSTTDLKTRNRKTRSRNCTPQFVGNRVELDSFPGNPQESESEKYRSRYRQVRKPVSRITGRGIPCW